MIALHTLPGVLLVADPPGQRHAYELLLTRTGRFVVRELDQGSPPRHQRIAPSEGRMLLALPESARFDGLCLAYHKARTNRLSRQTAPAVPEGQNRGQA